MIALITGASSGIGRDMARYLANMGWDLILVARRGNRLEELKNELKFVKVKCITADLSNPNHCKELYAHCREYNIDMIINNAGFGTFGKFTETDLDTELKLIDTNIKAVHILTKLFLQDFTKRNRGIILNVASSAGFLAGPLLSSYYASKNYVLRLTEAIYEELRRDNSAVTVSVFCPGPVKTEFDSVAQVKFALEGISSEVAAKYAIDNALNGKLIIMPTALMNAARVGEKLLPEKLVTKLSYNIQKRKNDKK